MPSWPISKCTAWANSSIRVWMKPRKSRLPPRTGHRFAGRQPQWRSHYVQASDLQFYEVAIPSPQSRAGSFDPADAARGDEVFRDLLDGTDRLVVLGVLRQQQERPGQPFLTGVEEWSTRFSSIRS